MATTILVVEDDTETLDVITIVLELWDYRVTVAKNGLEGIDRACAEHPDVIVTDIKMPKLDGIDMIKQLRCGSAHRRVPILVITAYDTDLANEAMLAGANRVLAKPLHPEHLLASIKNLLGERPNAFGAPH